MKSSKLHVIPIIVLFLVLFLQACSVMELTNSSPLVKTKASKVESSQNIKGYESKTIADGSSIKELAAINTGTESFAREEMAFGQSPDFNDRNEEFIQDTKIKKIDQSSGDIALDQKQKSKSTGIKPAEKIGFLSLISVIFGIISLAVTITGLIAGSGTLILWGFILSALPLLLGILSLVFKKRSRNLAIAGVVLGVATLSSLLMNYVFFETVFYYAAFAFIQFLYYGL